MAGDVKYTACEPEGSNSRAAAAAAAAEAEVQQLPILGHARIQ
jgi:hypothetical protein